MADMSESTQSQETTEASDPRDVKIAEQAAKIKELEEKRLQLEEKIKRLEFLLASKVDAVSSKTPVFSENYSLDRNKHKRTSSTDTPNKKSTGRKMDSYCSICVS